MKLLLFLFSRVWQVWRSSLPFALFAFACGQILAQQSTPKLLPFQGRLTDQSGGAVTNGTSLVQFKIYAVATGGSPVWAGEVHKTTVNGGLVNVLLGSKTPFSGVDFDRTLYLEITADINGDGAITAADPPMLPRQIILPAVFAKECADSRLLAGRDWTPIFGSNSPDGPIPATKLGPGSITALQVAPHTLTSNQIAPGSIGTKEIASNAVTSALIGPGTITSNNVALGQIHSGLLAPSAVGTSNLMDGAVTLRKMVPRNLQTNTASVGGVAISASSGNFSCNSYTVVSALTVTITTSGRPVFVGLIGDGQDGSRIAGETGYGPIIYFLIQRGADTICSTELAGSMTGGRSLNSVPPGALNTVDMPPGAGTYTYRVVVQPIDSNHKGYVTNSKLIAYEL